MPITPAEFREAIKTLREKTGMSQAAFAAHVGVAVPTVGRWEIAAHAPERASIQKILFAFKDNPDLSKLSVSLLSGVSETLSPTGEKTRGRYTVKWPETEIVAKLIDAIEDDALREEAMDRCRAELKKMRRSPRKAEQG